MSNDTDRDGGVRVRFFQAFGGRIRERVALTGLTTFRTGGTADWMLETSDPDDLILAAQVTRELDLPLTVLGGGSNVLVADSGLRGLLIRMRHGRIARAGSSEVRAEGGVTINGLVRWTIQRGLAGLERWAGTPGTVGGAVHGNAHFDGRLVGDLVTMVGLVDREGAVSRVQRAEMKFGYDDSRVQNTDEWVLWAGFRVTAGEPSTLRAAARRSLAFRKRTQPLYQSSAGCVFRNPCLSDGLLSEDIPRSAGALIERAGMRGSRVGGAVVSSVHGNFIVNEGRATSSDVRRLIEMCRTAVAERFGVTLREELIYLGEWTV